MSDFQTDDLLFKSLRSQLIQACDYTNQLKLHQQLILICLEEVSDVPVSEQSFHRIALLLSLYCQEAELFLEELGVHLNRGRDILQKIQLSTLD